MSGGLPGWGGRATHDRSRVPALRSPGAGHRVCPSALPGHGALGMMPEENLAAESRSPCDRSAGQGRGRPLRPPARPGGKESGGCGGSEFPSSPGPSLLRGIRSPAQIPAAGPLPGKGGEGERPGRGIFDVSLWGGCRFPYGGGRRACVRAELGVPGAASAPLGGCRAATRETLDARRGRVLGRPVAPAPARASWGHSPPASGHLCAPRPPSPSCPLGSPRAGGGNRRPRLDSASQAAAGSGGGKRGAAGSRGRSRVGACGPAERARVSRSGSRGAPAGGGAGRETQRVESAPRGGGPGGRRAGRAGRGDRLVRMAGRQERAAVGRACQFSRKTGPGAVPALRPQCPAWGAWGGGGLCERPRETWLGRRAAPLAGRLPGVSGWGWRFFESRLPPGDPRRRKRWHFIQTVRICRLP